MFIESGGTDKYSQTVFNRALETLAYNNTIIGDDVTGAKDKLGKMNSDLMTKPTGGMVTGILKLNNGTAVADIMITGTKLPDGQVDVRFASRKDKEWIPIEMDAKGNITTGGEEGPYRETIAEQGTGGHRASDNFDLGDSEIKGGNYVTRPLHIDNNDTHGTHTRNMDRFVKRSWQNFVGLDRPVDYGQRLAAHCSNTLCATLYRRRVYRQTP